MMKTKEGFPKVFTLKLDGHELSNLILGLEILIKNDFDILEDFNRRKPRPVKGIRACVYTLHDTLQLYDKLDAIYNPDEEDRTNYMQMYRQFKKMARLKHG